MFCQRQGAMGSKIPNVYYHQNISQTMLFSLPSTQVYTSPQVFQDVNSLKMIDWLFLRRQ